jgi:EmrB/QacA subfamily drug resistance transporter
VTVAENAARPLGELLDQRQKWLLLVSLMVALFVGALDQTIITTATPSILADLGGFDQLSWLFTSYMLASTIVVPLVGKLSDIYGRRPFVLGGIAIFMAASVACGAAPSMNALILFRVVQGVGGGMIFASVFTTIGDIFPPQERAKYIGLFTGTFSLASILGPTLGGFLTDHAGWRWVFFLNIPFGVAAMAAIWMNLPGRTGIRRPQIDYLGALLLSLCSLVFLLALVWAGREYDWFSWQILGLFAAALILLAAFLWQERRHPEPIVPLHLFRNRTFLMSNLIVFTLGAGMFGSLQYLAIFVQTALGASATASGIITTPQSLGLLATSIIGGQIIARTGHYRPQTILGAVLVLISTCYLATLHVDVPTWEISIFMALLGMGFGLLMPTMSLTVQSAVPHQYLGVATSSSQFFRQIGSVFGVAIFGAVLASSYSQALDDELSAEAQAQLGPEVMAELDDPTLALNEAAYATVQATVLAMPGGEALMADATSAQQEAVAVATRHIFMGAAAISAVCLLLVIAMKEIPLRKGFQSQPAAQGAGPPSGEPTAQPALTQTLPGAD